ncbi:MAG: O-succinylhomoserine sulfhydrylase [Rhodobacter sp.]|nr:O-succinylhomoserine sulfhydrylase [Rhodobacter sp.]
MANKWGARTGLVHDGTRRSQYGEMAEALYLTQGFAYDSAEQAEARFVNANEDEYIYARYGNPTVRIFEDRIAALEGAEDAFATASGMAAVSASLMSMLKAGDHVVSSRALFGSCLYIVEELLPRFGVEVTLVDGADNSQWKEAVRPDTEAVFLESLSNPTLELVDLEAVSGIARAAGARVIVDNVFMTPIYSNALRLGADIVVYSATKHIDGQGRCLGGVVMGSREYIRGTLEPYLKHTGGAVSPFNAWILLKGLETLDLRVRAMSASALKIARELQGHARVAKVIYPHLTSHPQHRLARSVMEQGGTVFSLEIRGGQAAAFRVLNALDIFTISNNLGDAKSIVTHPATTTHQRLGEERRALLGITPGLIRVSVGIEDADDLLRDFLQALNVG